VTRQVALKIIEADQRSEQISFPPEADLSAQLGVSRTVQR
jgi:DNA-binding FadR family transcriptional regulator